MMLVDSETAEGGVGTRTGRRHLASWGSVLGGPRVRRSSTAGGVTEGPPGHRGHRPGKDAAVLLCPLGGSGALWPGGGCPPAGSPRSPAPRTLLPELPPDAKRPGKLPGGQRWPVQGGAVSPPRWACSADWGGAGERSVAHSARPSSQEGPGRPPGLLSLLAVPWPVAALAAPDGQPAAICLHSGPGTRRERLPWGSSTRVGFQGGV